MELVQILPLSRVEVAIVITSPSFWMDSSNQRALPRGAVEGPRFALHYVLLLIFCFIALVFYNVCVALE